ncbi:alpha/beta hydrolase family protein [Altererythrobacter sp. GH1-8]|uniref:alpha/beta hydrolase family protein n=1 Tax=Altererythrobacter sp. GH1-8 TaxID=3349333 RepID=UPI00374CFCC2
MSSLHSKARMAETEVPVKGAGSLSLVALAAMMAGCASVTASPDAEPVRLSCAQRLASPSQEIALSVGAEEGRAVPITLFAPKEPGTYPLIGFSHGAFASPTRYRAMLAPLAGAGYIVVAPMHIDSEEFGSAERPSPLYTWNTRNLDMALALDPPKEIFAALEQLDLAIDQDRIATVGHSYGAIIAQIPGGAVATGPDGQRADFRNETVDAVVGWSPPGEVPGMISATGWNSLTAPTMTITGTTDILPGFIDDWRAHKASFDYAPAGVRTVWVGERIDHYFGGMFGREKPADANSRRLFDRALAVSLNFIDRHLNRRDVCRLGPTVEGETLQED